MKPQRSAPVRWSVLLVGIVITAKLSSVVALAAARAIENAPHCEVLCNVLELMLDTGSHEQEVAWLEWLALAVVKENASASQDDVKLVLLVRCLWDGALRDGERDIESATLQNDGGVIAGGTRDTRLSVGKMDHSATNWRSCGRDVHDEMLDAA
jgi:hypothetical protein